MNLNRSRTLLLSTLLLIPASYATTLFSTGFEPPTYAVGALNGQDGWTNAAVVENSVVFAGSQAVAMNSTGVTGQTEFFHGLSYNSAVDPNPLVVFDVEFMESSAANDPIWDIFAIGGNGGFINQVAVTNTGRVAFGTNTTAQISAGVWNDFQMVVNFSNDTVSVYLNSVFVSSDVFSSPSTTLTVVAAGINTVAGTDTATGYFDNFSVTVTPEPGSTGLVLAGLALLVVRYRRSSAFIGG
jgi:MYXO-CTERM domain-containing protein